MPEVVSREDGAGGAVTDGAASASGGLVSVAMRGIMASPLLRAFLSRLRLAVLP